MNEHNKGVSVDEIKVLWGVRKGNEDWQEEILSTQAERFDEVKKLAKKDGFDRFRVSVDDGSFPDFSKTVKRIA